MQFSRGSAHFKIMVEKNVMKVFTQTKKIILRQRSFPLFFILGFIVIVLEGNIYDTMAFTQNSNNEILVFAAASLTEACTSLANQFEQSHPGTKIVFNFGGSQQLIQQLANGAEADLYLPASQKYMTLAIGQSLVDSQSVKIFCHNRLVVILPKENPGNIHNLQDLAKPNLKIILAQKEVPAGQYALDFLDKCSSHTEFGEPFKQNVLINVVSYEENVKAVVGKIKLGEADAGIVYRSDVSTDSMHHLQTIDVPDSMNVIASYPVGTVHGLHHGKPAGEFLQFLLSHDGQSILAKFGFEPVTENDLKDRR